MRYINEGMGIILKILCQKVDISFNGILTTSIPPQGTAIIVNALKV
ncbi:hypothetical protein [Anaeromicrobium sediminis]|nr:hypothetical protein [Anaeromicrobium sediminis]